ncbi:MAG: SDR family NAD(P)-dependent oxidoreductase, partial [Bacteroidota bacterium]
MKIDLSGQVVLVTGGSRGIGAAIVKALGGTGATIALHFRQAQKEAE